MPNELPTPETRRETFLAAAAGVEVEKPAPITREEMFLDAIAGGGVSDAYTKSETDALLADKADLENGKVPAAQLPSYVDDVLEYSSTSSFPVTGESGKIYVVTDTNKTYRWGGSAYVEISESLALGETASTAYAGDKGKANADAIAKKPGEITTGKQYTISGQTVTAGTGAEAFNDLTNNKAAGEYSHAEGGNTKASGDSSHAEGHSTKASGASSHAEGDSTTASGHRSHAEGGNTTASAFQSHAEGFGTKASGASSHAEGGNTTASGVSSHAEGTYTIAASENQHVQGKYNVVNANNTYAFIIGNGTADNARHNAFAIDWNGLIYVNGAATGVDVSALYTKSEVDTALSGKANTSDLGAAAAKGFDAAPTSGHTDYAVSSDGVYQAMAKTDTVVHDHTAAGDYEEAFTINIPPGKTMQIMAGGAWSNSQCTGVKILYGGNKIIAVNEPSTSQSVVCASGCKRNGGSGQMAVKVLVRYDGATANEVYIVYTIV